MTRVLSIGLLLLALVAGPALQVLSASDWNIEHWPSRWTYTLRLLNSYPFGFFVVAIAAYTFTIKPPRNVHDAARAAAAITCAIVLQVLLFGLSLGLLFGIGDGTREMAVIGLSILGGLHALVIGTAHHVVLRSGVPAWLEIPSHMSVAGLSVFVLATIAGDFEGPQKVQLFGAWPALLVLLPYAVLIAIYTPRATNIGSALFAIALSAAPPYLVKAICDFHSPREQALTWPMRVLTHFDDTAKKRADWGKFIGSIRGGAPFQLGNGWFRLSSTNLFHQASTYDMTPSTPLRRLNLTVPMQAFAISKKPNPDIAPFVMLRLKHAADAEPQPASGPDSLIIPYRDLTVVLDYSGALVEPSQLEDLRRKTIDFVEAMRIVNAIRLDGK